MKDDSYSFPTAKEREHKSASFEERIPYQEIGREPEIPPETGIEKLEKEQHFLKKPVYDDQTGQVLVKPAQEKAKIVLPLSEEEYRQILKKGDVHSASTWLVQLFKRLLEKFGEKVAFRKKSQSNVAI